MPYPIIWGAFSRSQPRFTESTLIRIKAANDDLWRRQDGRRIVVAEHRDCAVPQLAIRRIRCLGPNVKESVAMFLNLVIDRPGDVVVVM
jgi:hypothetical protein